MMDWAEEKSWIPNELYGGRRNHEAIEVTMNRRLTADISQQRRAPLAIASVDAQTCYDRMAHSIASIAMQGWQVDPRAIRAMLRPIQHMKYFLRTAFGDSATFFGGIRALPFQGGCQGNKGAPAMWLVVSSRLVRLMHTLGLVTQIRAAMSAAGVEFAGFLFVDDTDLIALASTKMESVHQVVARIQAAVKAWHGGLRASGGALKPEKCSWCIVDYKWKDGQWYFTRMEDLPCNLQAPNLQGNLTSIE
jgi:hypothetical protein